MATSTWNVSTDPLTLEERPRRSPSRWLRQNSLRLAVLLGLAEAVAAAVLGFKFLIVVIGLASVLLYLNFRHRIPTAIRRPIWIVVVAQGIAGLAVPAIYASIFIASVLAVLVLLVLVLVLLCDQRRS
jgi:Na+-translocating ferredoxin:NAD+ oxidoreductase RnfE subunit